MQERKNSEAGNEKEVDYGRKSGQDNTSENVIENTGPAVPGAPLRAAPGTQF